MIQKIRDAMKINVHPHVRAVFQGFLVALFPLLMMGLAYTVYWDISFVSKVWGATSSADQLTIALSFMTVIALKLIFTSISLKRNFEFVFKEQIV